MTNDKSAEEIVRGLRETLPPQVDYAKLVCAEGFAHGQCYVWEDPEPYIISEAADLIESLQAQLTVSQQETRAAVEDIVVAHDMGRCAVCKHKGEDGAACKKWPDRSCFEWRGPQEAGEGER